MLTNPICQRKTQNWAICRIICQAWNRGRKFSVTSWPTAIYHRFSKAKRHFSFSGDGFDLTFFHFPQTPPTHTSSWSQMTTLSKDGIQLTGVFIRSAFRNLPRTSSEITWFSRSSRSTWKASKRNKSSKLSEANMLFSETTVSLTRLFIKLFLTRLSSSHW